jgi:hypothetical protein
MNLILIVNTALGACVGVILKTKFFCSSCGKYFKSEEEVQNHKDQVHDVIYLPIQKVDLDRLYQFLYSGNRELLTRSLVEVIERYHRASVKRDYMVQSKKIEE